MKLAVNTNEEFDYAELFDPGEGKTVLQGYGLQRTGSLYSPDLDKWTARDCPLCFEPFAVIRRRGVWICTACHRVI